MEKLVSVIIPAYNVEKYIAKNLDSVIKQTYQRIEILVVNDGSKDSTQQIVEEYTKKDSRISLINQKNKGLAGARNTGLAKAAGEYVCIFDADDLMFPEKIEKQLQFLEIHPTYDFVYSNVYHFIDGTNKIYFFPFLQIPQNKGTYESFLEYANYINPNSVFFKRSVYDQYGGFDEDTSSAEDWDYWLKISRTGVVIAPMSDFLTFYRIRADSLTRDNVTMNEAALYVFEKQQKFPQSKETAQLIEKNLIRYQFRLMVSYMRKNKKKEALLLSKKSMRLKKIYFLMTLVPVSLIGFLYEMIQKIRFHSRFKEIVDPEIKEKLKNLV